MALSNEKQRPAVIQWGKGAGRDFIQSRRISSLWISVSDQDQLPLTTTLGDGNVIEVKKVIPPRRLIN